MWLYAISGLCAGIAAVMILGRTTAGTSTHGQLYELDAIAAVVVGGTLLVGGRGTITGTVFGVLIFATLTNVFVQNNLDLVGAGRRQGRHHRGRGAAAAAIRQADRTSDMMDAAPGAGGLLIVPRHRGAASRPKSRETSADLEPKID